ncbi:MAG: glycosyltransferase family 39 protein [Planctomycetes bacterium]|nr:glycosyltransferase family 39 protein [Planctomycetota bacterium]
MSTQQSAGSAASEPRRGLRVVDAIGGLRLPTLLTVAAVLRLCWLWFCPNQPTSDQGIYHQAAAALAEGRGFVDELGQPHGWWPVGYPAALAPAYAWLGASPRVGHAVNLGFGLWLVAAVYRLAQRLHGARVAAWAGLGVAVSPTLVLMTTLHASENLFAPLSVTAVGWLVRTVPAGRAWLWHAAVVGVWLGLAAYVRAPALLLLALVPLWYWMPGRSLVRAGAAAAVAAAVALAVLLPWGLRTQSHFGTFQVVSMNGSSNFWMGNHPGSEGGYCELPSDVAGLSVPERERVLGQRAREFVQQHPLAYLQLCVRRVGLTLRSDTAAVVWNEPGLSARGALALVPPLKGLTSAVHWALLLLVLAGGWRARSVLGRADVLVVASLLLLAVPFVFVVGGNRYHLPLAPFLWLQVATWWRVRGAAMPQAAAAGPGSEP